MNHNQLIKLLECYRSDQLLSISAIVYNKVFNICSINTYRRLIAGESIRDVDHLLIDLFSGIDKKINDFDDTDLYDELYNSITTYDDNLIVSECDKVLSKLEHLKDCAYYDIVIESIEVIKAYYLNKTYSSEDFYWHYVKFEKVMNPKLNDIMYIMFAYCYTNGCYSNKVVWENKLYLKSKHIVGWMVNMVISMATLDYFQAVVISQEIESQLTDHKSLFYLKYLCHKLILMKLLNHVNDKIISEAKNLLVELDKDVSAFNKYTTLINIGYSLLLDKKYGEFIALVSEVVTPSNRLIKKELYLMFAYSQLELNYDKKSMTKIIESDDFILNTLYNYFLSNDLSLNEKNKIILNIYKKLDLGDFMFRFLVEEEIVKNCKNSNSYKALYELYKMKGGVNNG